MTIEKQAYSRRASGNVAAGQIRSAERRKCPRCGRRGALKSYSDELMFGFACRWEDCGYERMTSREFED